MLLIAKDAKNFAESAEKSSAGKRHDFRKNTGSQCRR
jgi:hypothetical protein